LLVCQWHTCFDFALKAYESGSEVITTPFTSVATMQAIHWNNLKPVFVDVNQADLNIDIGQVEAAITRETLALLPVHVFGNPCNVKGIDTIAHRNNVK